MFKKNLNYSKVNNFNNFLHKNNSLFTSEIILDISVWDLIIDMTIRVSSIRALLSF